MKDDNWVSLPTLTRSAGISESAALRCVGTFASLLRRRHDNGLTTYHVDGVAVLRRAAGLYTEGKSSQQVDEAMHRAFTAHPDNSSPAHGGHGSTLAETSDTECVTAEAKLADALQLASRQQAQIESLEDRVSVMNGPDVVAKTQPLVEGFWTKLWNKGG
jgi:hypothetical protein